MENLFFEIKGEGNYLKIELLDNVSIPGNNSDYDWLRTRIYVKANQFIGKYDTNIWSIGLFEFYQSLSQLYDNLNGSAYFEDIEDSLTINIKGDGIGHFYVEIIASDNRFGRVELHFGIKIDQTHLPEMIKQAERIMKEYSKNKE